MKRKKHALKAQAVNREKEVAVFWYDKSYNTYIAVWAVLILSASGPSVTPYSLMVLNHQCSVSCINCGFFW